MLLYELTEKQINKATTKEKLDDIKHKVDVFFLVGEFNDEQYKNLIKMIEEKEKTIATPIENK